MARITGIKEVRAAVRRLPQSLKDETVLELRKTVKEARATAVGIIDASFTRRTGDMRRNYRTSVSPKALTARIGYLTPNARRNAFYARFLHDGTSKIEGIPFHDRAIDAHEEDFYGGAGEALRSALKREGF